MGKGWEIGGEGVGEGREREGKQRTEASNRESELLDEDQLTFFPLCLCSSLRLLLEWGEHANPQDCKGETPLFLALCEGRDQCLDSLLEAGSSLQVVTTVSGGPH